MAQRLTTGCRPFRCIDIHYKTSNILIQPLKYRQSRLLRCLATIVVAAVSLYLNSTYAASPGCDDCFPRVAVKTNLLHDIALTPDIGAEIMLAKRFSLSVAGVYAWWSNDSRHRFWRIRGGNMEMRVWFGNRRHERALTGHHIGVYGSMHDYDFEFGGKGWQSPKATYGVGISYGYSLPLNRRLNLDLGVKAGYSAGEIIRYKPQCGTYVCTGKSFHRYFGITGLEITLVWFPGANNKNKPDYGL